MVTKGDFTKAMRHDPQIVRAMRAIRKGVKVEAVAAALEAAR